MSKQRVLLIEDNEDLRINTAEIVGLAGYEVQVAENGKMGVELAFEIQPDIIICDIMMPVLDGFGVLHAVRKHENLKNIPFIFLTAKSDRTDFRKGMESGAEDYLTKPFEPVELLRAIEIQLSKVKLKTELSSPKGSTFNPNDFEIHQFRKKHQLFNEGNRPQYLFYIKSGKVREYKVHPDGKEFTYNLAGVGDYIGLTDIIAEKVYSCNADVIEESEIHLIPVAEFKKALHEDSFSIEVIEILAKANAHQQDKSLGLAYDTVRTKVASALHEWIIRYGKGDEKIRIQLSREQLASIAGTATESLVRMLAEFRADQIIEIENGDIIVSDPDKLSKLIS